MSVASSGSEQSLIRDTGTITLLTLISRLTGLVRIAVVSAVLGATILGDVYQGSNMVPTLIFELIAGGAVQAVLVPMFVRTHDDEFEGAVGSVLGVLAVCSAAVTVLLIAVSPLLARAISVGSGDAYNDRTHTATLFIALFAPQLIFYSIGAVSAAALQARRKFVAGAIAPAVNNLVVISVYLLFAIFTSQEPDLRESSWKLVLLGGGTTLAVICFTSVPVLFLRRIISVRPRWTPRHSAVKAVSSVGWWATIQIGASLVPMAAAIVFGATNEGGVAVFSYAYAIFLLPFSLIAAPIATALMPRLASFHHANQLAKASDSFVSAVKPTAVVLLFASVTMTSLSDPISRILSFGELANSGRSNYGSAIAWMGCGVLGYGLWFISIRAMFAFHRVRSAAFVSLATAVMCVSLMAIGVSILNDVHSSVVLSGALSAGYTIGALIALIALPSALREGLSQLGIRNLISLFVAMSTFIAVALVTQRLWPISSRAESILLIIFVMLVATPLACIGGLLIWRPNDGSGRSATEIYELLGPSEGGIRRHVISLSAALAERGLRVSVVAPSEVVSFVEREEPSLPVVVSNVPTGFNPRRWISSVISLRRLVPRDAIIHCHGLKAGLLAILSGRRPVVTWHNQILDEVHGNSARLYKFLEKRVLARASHVIATTQEMVNLLVSWRVPYTRITMIKPVHKVPVPSRTSTQIRSYCGASNRKMIVCVARLNPQKGVDILLKAMKVLNESQILSGNTHVLVIVGGGPDANVLRAQAEDLGQLVNFVGPDDDAISFIQTADLVVIPSRWESGPLVAIEAHAFGRPIIATNTGFMSDYVGNPSVVIIEPDDVAALVAAISQWVERSNPSVSNWHESKNDVFDSGVDATVDIYRGLGIVMAQGVVQS